MWSASLPSGCKSSIARQLCRSPLEGIYNLSKHRSENATRNDRQQRIAEFITHGKTVIVGTANRQVAALTLRSLWYRKRPFRSVVSRVITKLSVRPARLSNAGFVRIAVAK
jgi:hypothetical protein